MKPFKHITTIVLLFCILFSFFDVNAQWFNYNNEIIPEIPSGSDSINVIGNIIFTFGFEETCPPLSSFNTSKLDTVINLELFYDVSGAWHQVGCTTSFANNIGVFNPGNYLLCVNTNTFFYDDTTFHIDSDTLELSITNNSSIIENRLESLIHIYPVPIERFLFLDFPDYLKIESMILFNIQGKRILRLDRKLKKLNLAGIDSGLYFLCMLTNKGSVTKKILVK